MGMSEHGPTCSLCGAVMTWEDCDYCEGTGDTGLHSEYDPCPECAGDGGEYTCLSPHHDEALKANVN